MTSWTNYRLAEVPLTNRGLLDDLTCSSAGVVAQRVPGERR